MKAKLLRVFLRPRAVLLSVGTVIGLLLLLGASDCPPPPCECCTANPEFLSFTTELATGTNGVLSNFRCSDDINSACANDGDCAAGTCDEVIGGGIPTSLEADSLYFGHGMISAPPQALVPDGGEFVTRANSCSGDTLILGPTTPAEVGKLRCTQGSYCSDSPQQSCAVDADCGSGSCETTCLFGPPVAVPVADFLGGFLSVCVINQVAEDASGSAQCSGSAMNVSIPLRSRLYWSGDILPDTPGIQPCPICVAGTCDGGLNDGLACTAATSSLGEAYPTSHDCPPDPGYHIGEVAADIGGLPLTLSLTTGTIAKNAVDQPSAQRSFFGFCQDLLPKNHYTLCVDGDPAAGCPDSAAQPNCLPELKCSNDPNQACNVDSQCTPPGTCSLQVDISGCGNAIPCNSDSDCQAPYESCAQDWPGAFAKAAASRISVSGSTEGICLDDWRQADLVSVFGIPPTFDALFDPIFGLGGPGVVQLHGKAKITPVQQP